MLPLLVRMGCCPGEQVLEPLTQSFIEVAPECIVVLPDAQSVHTTDPVSFAYVFIWHSMHMAPLGLNLPAAQSMQLVGSAAVEEGILPALQVRLPPPAGDTEQAVADVEPEPIVVIPFLQAVQYRPFTE